MSQPRLSGMHLRQWVCTTADRKYHLAEWHIQCGKISDVQVICDGQRWPQCITKMKQGQSLPRVGWCEGKMKSLLLYTFRRACLVEDVARRVQQPVSIVVGVHEDFPSLASRSNNQKAVVKTVRLTCNGK